ncbi:winged helix-turn-helix transcriptional regulator [Sphingomonas crocodyli]|uniref:Transcriptional regulator n=1 Tax=Sphingomonas crocodyli TaxID=1979270 RepID=A0A437M9X9_9SPHN|nr:helix-turn-helix domain-containing protein [Sphingomonas crocodyli]RVT94437.1 transcriptional regulator [Sphingomonas crocodyli]
MKLEKVTDSTKRSYDDACGAAHGLDLVGDRWALLVVRELMFGPRRFSDLRGGLPGISANVLTQRLEGLEASGVVTKRKLPPPINAQVYELTDWGYEAKPILEILGRWAARSPGHDPSKPLSAASLLLSFGTMIDMKRVGVIAATIGFRLNGEDYIASVGLGGFAARRGDLAAADVVFTASPAMIAAVVYGGAPIDIIQVEGSAQVAEWFVGLFPLPEKAAP